MSLFKITLLGIIQGLTEFLPISSSGHLVIAQNFLHVHESGLIFDISLHVGTLIAVIITLRREVRSILKIFINFPTLLKKYGNLKRLYTKDKGVHLLVLLIMGSIPTAIIGLLFNSFTGILFKSIHLTGSMLLVSGTVLWMTKKTILSEKKILQMQIKDSLIIGSLQGVAVMPGLSRSGVTISTGLLLGMDRETAGRYSFLLSIPAILGALALSLYSSGLQITIRIDLTLIGIVVSAITGCMALKFMLFIVKNRHLHTFTPYCYLAGLVALTIM